MNLPNKLTLSRLLAVVVITILYLIFKGNPWCHYLLFALFILASFTDFLDGKIARKYNLVTGFGKLMDPLADKLLVIVVVIILMDMGIFSHNNFPASLATVSLIIIIARELLVSGVRLVTLEGGGVVVAASIWGKAKTFTQMIAISLLTLYSAVILSTSNWFSSTLFYVGIILFYASVILLIISGAEIYLKNKKYFKTK